MCQRDPQQKQSTQNKLAWFVTGRKKGKINRNVIISGIFWAYFLLLNVWLKTDLNRALYNCVLVKVSTLNKTKTAEGRTTISRTNHRLREQAWNDESSYGGTTRFSKAIEQKKGSTEEKLEGLQFALLCFGSKRWLKSTKCSPVWQLASQWTINQDISAHIVWVYYSCSIPQAWERIVSFQPAKHTCESWLLCTDCVPETHTRTHLQTQFSIIQITDAPLKMNYSPLVFPLCSPTVNLVHHLINSPFYCSQTTPSTSCQT